MKKTFVDYNWLQPTSFLKVIQGCVKRPSVFFSEMPADLPVTPPLIFLVVASIIADVGSYFIQTFFSGISITLDTAHFLALTSSIVQQLVFSFLVYLSARYFCKAEINLSQALRLVCYSFGAFLFAFLGAALPMPWLALIQAILLLVCLRSLYSGLKAAGNMNPPMAIAAMLIPLVITLLVYSIGIDIGGGRS